MLGPNQEVELHVQFAPMLQGMAPVPLQQPDDFRFGDASLVEIGVYMDGAFVGGFTAEYQLVVGRVFLPIVSRNTLTLP